MSNSNRKVLNGKFKGGKDPLNSYCTITEAVQIARGAAEDVVTDYHRNQSHLQLSLSIQLDVIKGILIEKGLVTEEEYRDLYMAKAKEIQELQEKMAAEAKPNMQMSAGDIEVKVEE